MARKPENGTKSRSLAPRSRATRTVEVFFHDASAVYDAPLEALWDFMQKDEEFHPQAHGKTLRNFKGKDLSPNSFEATYEVWRGGKWRRARSRHAEYRPVCKIGEHLEGDYAGTVILIQYWPVGRRTRVEVWARLRSDVLSARELRAHWRESFAQAYREDVAVLPGYLKKHGKGRTPPPSAKRAR